jgi:hypothetical protein
MEGLGELGFWLGLGIFLGGGAIAGALKEIAKEREKQATHRALLTAKGESMPEVLAYLREKDAAEAAREYAQWVAMGGTLSFQTVVAGIVSAVVGVVGFIGGIMAFSTIGHSTQSWLAAVGMMLGIWAGGLLIAFLVFSFFRERKKDSPPGA